MGNEFKNFINSEQSKKLSDRKSEVQELASSQDGQKVKEILKGRDLESALQKGDTDTLRNAFNDVMKSEAGARIISQLQKMMGEK